MGMKVSVDKIFAYRGGYLFCEITIYEDTGKKRSGMSISIDLSDFKYDILG
jgi:hypothetical protein